MFVVRLRTVACVDKEGFVFEFGAFPFVKEPQCAREGLGVEEVITDGEHAVHVSRFNELLSDVSVSAAAVRGRGSHDEARASCGVEVCVEILNPQVIGVTNLVLLIVSRQSER